MFGMPCPGVFVSCTPRFYDVPFGIISHDGCGYLTHSLGKQLCHLWAQPGHGLCRVVAWQAGYSRTIWIAGWALPVSRYGHGMGMGDTIGRA